jgi:SAM-dependent methyltransferase
MSINIYDRDDFFEEYNKLERSQKGLDGALEWPLLRDMVGDVKDARILDLGCGMGWFCEWAVKEGSKSVRGVDISNNMLERARARVPQGTFDRADLETFTLKDDDQYDLVYSSVALHYLPDITRLVGQVYAGLVPGGRFVFSVEHPVFTSPRHAGWRWDPDHPSEKIWPVNAYSDESKRVTNWLAEGFEKYHRTMETYLTTLLSAGFRLVALKEWMVTEETVALNPGWRYERDRPLFLLISVEKPA